MPNNLLLTFEQLCEGVFALFHPNQTKIDFLKRMLKLIYLHIQISFVLNEELEDGNVAMKNSLVQC